MLGRGIKFQGNYATWQEATEHAAGYSSPEISARLLDVALKVLNGEIAFERDGVEFREYDPPFPLLAILLRIVAENNGNLVVLDFGGGMGSQYFQCQPWLNAAASVKWIVVEQASVVDAAQRHLTTDNLSFMYTVDEALAQCSPTVVLFSGVLQYLAEPFSLLAKILSSNIPNLIIDRTPFTSRATGKIVVQRVPKNIIESSYPAHLFSKQEFFDILFDKYRLECEFQAIDGRIGSVLSPVDFLGFYFRSK